MKKKLLLSALLFYLILPIQHVLAKSSYSVEAIDESAKTVLIASGATWEEAQSIYNEHEEGYTNLMITKDERILKVKYGFIAFHKSETCDRNISFQQGNESGYTNGCYGIDAAYLSSSDDGNQVSFLLSGAYGTADIDDVELYPIESNLRLSSYLVQDGKLYHQIKTEMSHDLYANSIYLGDAPEYLQDDMTYFSYDAHYFYPGDSLRGYYQMIDDLKASSHTNAINADAPYYNYYQYITHRTKTAYSEAEINAYFDDTLRIQSPLTTYKSIGTSYHALLTQSMLKSQANAFLQYQDQFGANALMMLALSMNESATGRSYLAYTRNNVFGHAAYDSAVEENASRYDSIAASIYSHAKHYISTSYLNPAQFQYHGGHFGSKSSGMNISYASDPYWGEKAAQYYARLDEALGEKDKNSYALGIVSQHKNVNIYKEASQSSDILYTNDGLLDFPFVLLEKQGDWYKIQSDPAASEDGYYQFSHDVGYVSADDINIILHEENINVKQTYNINFDASGGHFQGDLQTITLQVDKDHIPCITPPQKENALFTGWNTEVLAANYDTTYIAQYKEVKKAEVLHMKKTTYTSDEQLDVSGAILKITFLNDEVLELPFDSSMVSNYDTDAIGNIDITVKYQGITTSFLITMNPQNEEKKTELLELTESTLQNIDKNQDLSSQQQLDIMELKQEIDQSASIDLSYNSYRKLDWAIQKAYGSSLQILVQGDMDAQVSGLSIATKLSSPSLFPTILKFNLTSVLPKSTQTILSNIAQANNYTPENFFEISGKHDFHTLDLKDDLLVSIKKPEHAEANIRFLIMQYKDENVYQIPTSQSDSYITFPIDSFGEFSLVSQSTSNIYKDSDIQENNFKDNNGHDIVKILFFVATMLTLMIILIISIIIRRKRSKKDNAALYTSPTQPISQETNNEV